MGAFLGLILCNMKIRYRKFNKIWCPNLYQYVPSSDTTQNIFNNVINFNMTFMQLSKVILAFKQRTRLLMQEGKNCKDKSNFWPGLKITAKISKSSSKISIIVIWSNFLRIWIKVFVSLVWKGRYLTSARVIWNRVARKRDWIFGKLEKYRLPRLD